MALQDKFQYLNDTKNAIRQSIINKGVPVSVADTFRSYSSKIDAIQQGGSEPTTGDYLVRFYDYDGSLLKEEWVDSGEDATPPTGSFSKDEHASLLSFKKWYGSYTAVTSNKDVYAVYETADGNTYLFFERTPAISATAFILLVSAVPQAIEFYLDGVLAATKTTTANNEAISQSLSLPLGSCIVKLVCQYADSLIGGTAAGEPSSVAGMVRGTSLASPCVTKVFMGNHFRIMPHFGHYVFENNINLKKVMLPERYVCFGQNIFFKSGLECAIFPYAFPLYQAVFRESKKLKTIVGNPYTDTAQAISSGYHAYLCSALSKVKLTQGRDLIGVGAFRDCSSLEELEIPPIANQTISSSAFSGCIHMKKYIFSGGMPTLAATDAFTGINPLCKIYVRDDLVDTYKTATNWVAYANYIYPISEMEA